ncbi:MAG: 2-octaprenyl-6-methoxyphenyl hydroxylase [Alphaproteobacteria bacterium]|nr:2-octaprenyl-6-methoxyphenyl hydroxylase [Alphaproteobacteria bacterium]
MASSGSQQTVIDVEALIVGGGLVGLTLASALAGAGLPVAVVDRADPATTVAPEFDGRATAVANGSVRLLRGIGLWDAVAPHASAINDIRVSDGDSLLFLHYDHREIGDEPLGQIIENRHLRVAMLDHVRGLEALEFLAPMEITEITRGANGVVADLADGRRIRARLLLACDGRNSGIREAAGIGVTRLPYNQTSIVCAVFHDRPHNNVAHERFLPGGPFAILPMADVDGRHRSAIVWSDRSELTPAVMALDEASFVREMAPRFGDILGELELAGPRWSHPLALSHAQTYIGQRLALVGDAAHAIHPIAGQGLNMGIRDIAALAEVIIDARRLGRDIGTPDLLADYERWRRFDNMVLAVVTDVITRLFSNDVAPLRTVRSLGLGTVNRVPPLRRTFMRHATGTVGDLPRLVRGEAL